MPPVRRPWSRPALSILLAAVVGLAACSEKSEIGPGDITQVRVSPDTLVLVLGLSDTLKAFPIDERGSFLPDKAVAWASNDGSVVTVDADGLVTGTGLGMTMVTATAGKVTGTAVVQVVQPRLDPPATKNFSTGTLPPASLAQNATMVSIARTAAFVIGSRAGQSSSPVRKNLSQV